MKKYIKLTRPAIWGVAVVLMAGTAGVRAINNPAPPSLGATAAIAPDGFQVIDFRDRPEADMMRRAYRILATGDHDYKGHRAKAMKAVKKAAELLKLDLGGDDQYREKQALSDDKLREAQGLLEGVLGAAEVKGQEKITKRIKAAIHEINLALDIR